MVRLQAGNHEYYYNAKHYTFFERVWKGKATGWFIQEVGFTNDVCLKIAREGNEYSGYFAAIDPAKPYDVGKVEWTKLGTLPRIGFEPKLALCAGNYQDAPEVGAEFFSVTIRKK